MPRAWALGAWGPDPPLPGANDGTLGIRVSFSHSVSVRPEVDSYNMSWNPGRSPTGYNLDLNLTGCDFDMYVLPHNMNRTLGQCSTTCPDEDITDTVARQNCNGTGCCSTDSIGEFGTGFDIKFVRHKIGKRKFKTHSNRSSIWDTIDVTSNYASISWAIAVDEPASIDYPCLRNHSLQWDMTNLICHEAENTTDMHVSAGITYAWVPTPNENM
jgi:hypothetical protein